MTTHRIYWLASYPKSGNTWLRLFLQSYLYDDDDINADLIADDLPADHYQAVSLKPTAELTPNECVTLRPAMLLRLLHSSPAHPVYLKTHHARVKMLDTSLIPPQLTAGGVYLVRDPRDVVISYSHHLGKTFETTLDWMCDPRTWGTKEGTDLWHLLTSWSDHVESWLHPNSPATVIRYEDLCEHPEATFRRVLHALGVSEIDATAFQAALERTELPRLRDQEERKGFTGRQHQDRFFGQGGSRWQDILSPDLAGRVSERFAETMEKVGYAPSAAVNTAD